MSRIGGLLGITAIAIIGVAMALATVDIISRSQFDLIFAVACGNTVFAFMVKTGFDNVRAVVFALLLTGGAVAAKMTDSEVMLAPYLAVVFINGLVAYIFAHGLLPGREPLMLQIVKLMDSGYGCSSEFLRFIRGQCWVWAGFGLFTSLCGLAAMVFPFARSSAVLSITVSVIAQIAWFVLSHLYANRRYGRPETWIETLRVFLRPAVWAELAI